MRLGDERLHHGLHGGREKVALECRYAAGRLRGDEVDADDTAVRPGSLKGDLDRCDEDAMRRGRGL